MLKQVRKYFPKQLKTPAIRMVVDLFHRHYYHSGRSWNANYFLGHKVLQCPFDLFTYQEILFEKTPRFVLQTGVFDGGSLFYLASMLDLLKAPPEVVVIGVDIELRPDAKKLDHPRIKLVEGSSTDPATLARVESLLPAERGMVVLDSDHSESHVYKELQLYHRYVDVGSYLVVEDTNVNGHPVFPGHGPGPYEATVRFLKETSDFVQDDDRWNRHLFSFHQYGWLKRVK